MLRIFGLLLLIRLFTTEPRLFQDTSRHTRSVIALSDQGKPRIKEIARARRHHKPDKPGTLRDSSLLKEAIRDRRPQGLDRPPEIPR